MRAGSRLRLLGGGRVPLERMAAAVEVARRRVWLETFILRPDPVGKRFLRLLKDAAGRGVETVLLVDALGSAMVGPFRRRKLERAGVQVLRYNPPLARHVRAGLRSPLYRDHRKILVADEVAFTGGHNLSKQYLGPGKRRYWDLTVEVEGPVVADLAAVLAAGAAGTGERLPQVDPPGPLPGGVPAAVEALDRKAGVDSASPALRNLIAGARERCYLMLAYFLPEPWLLEALSGAAARGVDVRLLLAGKTDLPMVRGAARHLYEPLLESGVRLFELRDQRLHAKAAVADGEHLLVGTFDYNRFSARYSLEVSVSARDPGVGQQLEELIVANTKRAREASLARWRRRGPVARAGQVLSFGALDRLARAGKDEGAPPGGGRD